MLNNDSREWPTYQKGIIMAEIRWCSTFDEWEELVNGYFAQENTENAFRGDDVYQCTFKQFLNKKRIWAPEFTKVGGVRLQPAYYKYGYVEFTKKDDIVTCWLGSENFCEYAAVKTTIEDCKYRNTLVFKILSQPLIYMDKCRIIFHKHAFHGHNPTLKMGDLWHWEVADYHRKYDFNKGLGKQKIKGEIDFTYMDYAYKNDLYALSGKVSNIQVTYIQYEKSGEYWKINKGKGYIIGVEDTKQLVPDRYIYNNVHSQDFIITLRDCTLFAGFRLTGPIHKRKSWREGYISDEYHPEWRFYER